MEAVVPLACIVYNLKPSILATLLASLLMERRVILLSSSFATMATAVHAAAALLHPFKWHNVFLPLLPADLLDVLCSPTPYLVGMPVRLKDEVDWDVLDEVVIVNLDEDSINPAVGADGSDSDVLPGWQQLVSAFSTMQVRLCLLLRTCAASVQVCTDAARMMHELPWQRAVGGCISFVLAASAEACAT